MISEATTNYKKQALQDIIDFISGKIQESEFLQKYKVNATKSHDYVDIVSDVLHSNHVYDAKFAQSVDMQETDFEPLKRAGANYAAEKLGWRVVDCSDGENIRSIESIHEELLAITKEVNK